MSNALRLHRAVNSAGKRSYHDLLTVGAAKKPIVSQGPPGYSAVSGHVATVFGATGFLGRYLVSKLGRMGTQVIVAYRDEDTKRILKPMGDLGQIVPMEWDLRSEQQIAECLRHSDIVFNLTGRNYETKNYKFDDVHAVGAQRIAKIASECGVSRFVQVSHLNASPDSPSAFYQSKFKGEELVKEAFSDATIVRPGPMYGYEDKFLRNLSEWPMFWKFNGAKTLTRPAHVMDVAQALTNLVSTSVLPRTLNLPGPSTLSHEYLLDLVTALTYNPVSSAPGVPQVIASLGAKILNSVLWWPMLSPDEIVRRCINDSDVSGDWDVVGITPAEIEQNAIAYVRRYRNATNYGRPVVLPGRPQSLELN